MIELSYKCAFYHSSYQILPNNHHECISAAEPISPASWIVSGPGIRNETEIRREDPARFYIEPDCLLTLIDLRQLNIFITGPGIHNFNFTVYFI